MYIPPKPRPTYPNKLLVQNVKDSTTRDCLSMFLENITGLEPEEIIYGDEPGVVLISFHEEPGLCFDSWSGKKNTVFKEIIKDITGFVNDN